MNAWCACWIPGKERWYASGVCWRVVSESFSNHQELSEKADFEEPNKVGEWSCIT